MKKKIFTYTVMMMATMFGFTSCDTDEMIADYLVSGNWEGYLDTYYVNCWGEEFQDGSYKTVWRFDAYGYDEYGYATSGTGYEVDYSPNSRYDYAYSPFYWEVRNGNIYIDYKDPNWNPARIDYRDYSISRSHFRGTMYDWENRSYDFDMTNISYFDWGSYSYYYSRTRSSEGDTATDFYVSEDGMSVASGKFAKVLNARKK